MTQTLFAWPRPATTAYLTPCAAAQRSVYCVMLLVHCSQYRPSSRRTALAYAIVSWALRKAKLAQQHAPDLGKLPYAQQSRQSHVDADPDAAQHRRADQYRCEMHAWKELDYQKA